MLQLKQGRCVSQTSATFASAVDIVQIGAPAPRVCYHCQRRTHHRPLCPQKFGNSSSPSDTLNPGARNFVPANASASLADCDSQNSNVLPAHVSVTTPQPGHCQVIMQTALAELQTCDGTRQCRVRLYFDTGSSRSFTHSWVQDALQAEVLDHDVLYIAKFGSRSRETTTLPRIEVRMKMRGGSFHTTVANVTDHISRSMERIPLDVEKHPSLRRMALAEPIATRRERFTVDMLLAMTFTLTL